MTASLRWRWWGWGAAELTVSDTEHWLLSGPPGGTVLRLSRRRSANRQVPTAHRNVALHVKLGLFSSHDQLLWADQRYRLKPVGFKGNRFELIALSAGDKTVLYRFQRLPHVIGCEDAEGRFVASALPEPPGVGYTPRWQVERAPDRAAEVWPFPLDLICLALLVRTDHWSHRQPMR